MLDKHLIAETHPIANRDNVVIWGDYRVTVLSDRLFRIEQDEKHRFCDEATLAVWYRNMPRTPFRRKSTEDVLTIRTSKVILSLSKQFENSYIQLGRKHIAINNAEALPGTFRTLDGYDGAYKHGNKNEPAELCAGVTSKNGVAVYDDVATPVLLADGTVAAREPEEKDLYVFAFGSDYRAAVRALYMICGATPMLPRYALGNWWSRYHVYTDREYLHVLDRLAQRDLPFTVATIDMDWHESNDEDMRKKYHLEGLDKEEYIGDRIGWTGYTWNKELFPDHKQFLKQIKDRNLRITLNLHPAAGFRFWEDSYEKMAHVAGVDPASKKRVKFKITNPDFVNHYFSDVHKPMEEEGVDFWWIDWQQGTETDIPGLDPLWALNHYHTLDNAVNHTPLILSRYSGIGAHRYPLGFSGDTYVTWDSLAYIPAFTANATNVGYTWWSHDIGGHQRGCNDGELFARYVQFGAFSPINRLHCTSNPVFTKEPVTYMNGAGLVAEEFLRLRHSMIPYLYSASYETTYNGRALIEPMYYAHPEDNNAYKFSNQYYFGDQLLVAPVTTHTDKSGLALTKVWLPAGHWTDIFTGDEYEGGRTVTMARWLDNLPVLLKEGGIFVLDGRRHTNDVSNPDILRVAVANGDGSYVLHEDDGNGNWAHTSFKTERKGAGRQTLTFRCADPAGVTPKRDITFEFRNIETGTVTVTANGLLQTCSVDDNGYLTVAVKGIKANVPYTVEVSYTEKTKADFLSERLIYSLQRIVFDTVAKEQLYHSLKGTDEATYRKTVHDCALPASAKVRLLELL